MAIVGSGPGVMQNRGGFIDGHDVVIRVNNYKIFPQTGFRTDIYYSFFGASIKKHRKDLIHDGVKLCWCKCPNDKFIESRWHRENNKMRGVDFRYIYDARRDWWFCKTYVPTVVEFLEHFNLLGRHVPTTGFAAILDTLKYNPEEVYITGFDFFQSGVHNVNEPWAKNNHDDPIGHAPELELKWLRENMDKYPIKLDSTLQELIHKDYVRHQSRERLYPPLVLGNRRPD